jgi:hypothetical protein
MGRPKRSEDRTRLHIDVPTNVKDRLEELRIATNAESLGEVFRRALAVYDMVVTETTEKKSRVVLRDEKGREREVVIV